MASKIRVGAVLHLTGLRAGLVILQSPMPLLHYVLFRIVWLYNQAF